MARTKGSARHEYLERQARAEQAQQAVAERRCRRRRAVRRALAKRRAHGSKDAAVHLFELPQRCLDLIVEHMDATTKENFFKASKGSMGQLGCAKIVLQYSKPTYTFHFPGKGERIRESSMLHWVSQHSSNVHVSIQNSLDTSDETQLDDILQGLLVFEELDEDVSDSDVYVDAGSDADSDVELPVEYPGVTSLEVKGCQSGLIPRLVKYAFPNLTRLSISCTCCRWFSKLEDGGVAARIQHLTFKPENIIDDDTEYVEQQLSYMRSLTSLDTFEEVLLAAPPRVLNKLTQLAITSDASPDPNTKSVLDICISLRSLTLYVEPDYLNEWLAILPREDPDICELHLPDLELSHAKPLTHILALTHVTQLRLGSLDNLSEDFSGAGCRWQQLRFDWSCSSDIVRLPLHNLDSPVECSSFHFYPTADLAADMAAINAAREHLIRCGGIRPRNPEIVFSTANSPTITKEQAAELLQAWAPCFPQPIRTITGTGPRAKAVRGAAKVWPDVDIVVGF